MDEQLEALNRKRAKSPGITILVDDPESVEVLPRKGKIGAADPGMESLASGDLAEAAVPAEGESSEDDMRENPDMAPGVYDKGVQGAAPAEDPEEDDMAAEVFDEGETMRRKADGQGKPKSLTDRAAFAAFKGRKKK